MLASMGISCCVFVCPSVTSQRSTETAKCRIMHRVPHDRPGTLVFWCRKSWQNSHGITPKGTICRRGRLNAGAVTTNRATFDVKRCQISFVAILSHRTCTLLVFSTFAMMQCVRWVCHLQQSLVQEYLTHHW